jgi:hypothetical protein
VLPATVHGVDNCALYDDSETLHFPGIVELPRADDLRAESSGNEDLGSPQSSPEAFVLFESVETPISWDEWLVDTWSDGNETGTSSGNNQNGTYPAPSEPLLGMKEGWPSAEIRDEI